VPITPTLLVLAYFEKGMRFRFHLHQKNISMPTNKQTQTATIAKFAPAFELSPLCNPGDDEEEDDDVGAELGSGVGKGVIVGIVVAESGVGFAVVGLIVVGLIVGLSVVGFAVLGLPVVGLTVVGFSVVGPNVGLSVVGFIVGLPVVGFTVVGFAVVGLLVVGFNVVGFAVGLTVVGFIVGLSVVGFAVGFFVGLKARGKKEAVVREKRKKEARKNYLSLICVSILACRRLRRHVQMEYHSSGRMGRYCWEGIRNCLRSTVWSNW